MTTLIVFAAIYDTTAGRYGRPVVGSEAMLGLSPEPERSVTAYAIAASLGRPYKTVRRKIDSLVDRGVVTVTGSGVRVADGALDSELLREPARLIARAGIQMQRRFVELGLIEAADQAALEEDVPARFAAVNSFALHSLLVMNSDSNVGLSQTALFLAMGQANTRHLGRGDSPPYQSYREVIPDTERRPVTALALAEELAMPRETTRRNLWDLVGAGHCYHVRGGFIVNEQTLHTETSQARAAQIQASVRRLMRTLQ